MSKIIALDIDGTLLSSQGEITARTKKALEDALKEGNIVVIASGRDPKGVFKYAQILKLDEYNGLLSNYNGGRITNYETKEVIINHTLNLDDMKELLIFSEDLDDMNYTIYYDGKCYTNSMDTYRLEDTQSKNDMELIYDPDLSYKVDFRPNNVLFACHPEKISEPSNKIYDKFSDKFALVKSTPYYYEVMPKGVSKGESLIEIAKYYDIPMDDVIAFGDEDNDLSMIEAAGVGVVMANGSKAMLKAADYVTLSNDEDGIADYLEKFILKKEEN